MDNLYNLLLQIHKKPYEYLEKPTLNYLYTFISGYIVCRNYLDKKAHYDFYPGFQKFIEDRFKIRLSLHHMDIIKFYCISEEEAFEKYFELLDEYLYYEKIDKI